MKKSPKSYNKPETTQQMLSHYRKKIGDAAFARLWAKSAGRCEFEGCNCILYEDALTSDNCHQGEGAHIYAFKENGPRGDVKLSAEMDGKEENYMLLCHNHHRLIDHEQVNRYDVDRLRKMKKAHEDRIRSLTEMKEDCQSTCLVYISPVGETRPSISDMEIRDALSGQKKYPREKTIRIESNAGVPDWSDEYWKSEKYRLTNMFHRYVNAGNINEGHYSVFALAPQPLLVKLGFLLHSMSNCDIYQRHRNAETWKWPINPANDEIHLTKPINADGKVVLIVAISAIAIVNKVKDQLSDEQCSYWEIVANNPQYDWVSSQKQQAYFRRKVEDAFDDIRSRSHATEIHLFMAAPASCSIILGRAWMPKIDLPLVLYNVNPNEQLYRNVMTLTTSNI